MENAWLIEKPFAGGVLFLGEACRSMVWTSAQRAIRFSRKEDGEAMLRALRESSVDKDKAAAMYSDCSVHDHGFYDPEELDESLDQVHKLRDERDKLLRTRVGLEAVGEEEVGSQTLLLMEEYGGSFARALARAYISADAENRSRLRSAFPELWSKYTNWARETERADDGR